MTPEQREALQRAAIAAADAQLGTPEPQGLASVLYENVVGRGEVDTPGERLGERINDFASSLFPGMARGAAELVGLPGTINDVMDIVPRRIGLLPQDDPGSILSGQSIRSGLSNLTNGATEYRGDSRLERYAGTIGEFIPGALGGGVRGLLTMGVAPGAASEAAGQATEGTAFEPFARAGAGILAALAGGAVPPRRIGPGSIDDETRRLGAILDDAGVPATAGQMTGSDVLRNMEGTVSPRPRQLEGFTEAAMRTLGGDDIRATPAALNAAQNRIGQVMDDALQGVSIRPDQAMAQQADSIVQRYLEMAPGASVVPRIRGIADEIMEGATNPAGTPVDLSTLREWRTALGRLVGSSDEATREAAIALRGMIDEATDNALTTAGRGEDLARLQEARTQYRNFLAIRDAATRAGAEIGVISPTQLNQAIIRTQGRDSYGIGRGTELAELSRAGAAMFRPVPAVEAGAVRRLSAEAGMFGLGGTLGFAATGTPMGAALGGILGSATVPGGQAIMRSRAAQGLLNDPAFIAAAVAARATPGLLANRPAREP